MTYGFLADLHLTMTDSLSHVDSESGFSIRTLDKFKALDKAIKISVERGCKAFFLLGDIFDKLNPQDRLRRRFYATLQPYFGLIDFYIIVGNHDGADFTHNYLSEKLLLEGFKNPPITIIDQPTLLSLGHKGEEILCLPWNTNLPEVVRVIEDQCRNILCLAHLEIIGALSSTEYTLTSGLSAKVFNKFRYTFMGHYHRFQEIMKVVYVGSPVVKDLSELGITKGFIIYDYQLNQYDHIELEERQIFKILVNENDDSTIEAVENLLASNIIKEGSIIELTIQGSVHWVREARTILYKDFSETKPLKLLIKKKIVSEDNQVVVKMSKTSSKVDRIKEYSKEKPDWAQFGINFFIEAENKFMEGK